MSAVNSLQPPEAPGEPFANEPSMEEILASIRRIIADDQSLPAATDTFDEPSARSAEQDHPAETLRPPSPIHVLRPLHGDEVNGDEVTSPHEEQRAMEQDQPLAAAMARGSIAAPQFVGPDGPAVPASTLTSDDPIEPIRNLGADLRAAVPMAPTMEASVEEPLTAAIPDGGASTMDHHVQTNSAARHEADGPVMGISAATQKSVAAAFNTLAVSRLADNSEELRALARDMLRPMLTTWLDDNLPGLVERLVRDEIERVVRGGH